MRINLSLILTGLLVVSCGGSGRSLRVAVTTLPSNLDPIYSLPYEGFRIAVHMYESLLKLDSDREPAPNLARRWNYNDSLTELTIWLRDDVHFHDGTLLEAEHVVASLSRIAFPAESQVEIPAATPGILGSPEAITVLNDSTVVIRLQVPHSPLLRALATPDITPIVGPSIIETGEISIPVGTGPYRLSVHNPEKDSIELRRFRQYWSTQPVADRLIFSLFRSSEAAIVAIEEGRTDLTLSLSVSSVPALSFSEDLTLVHGTRSSYLCLGLNNRRPPFNEVEARRALAMSLDVPSIVSNLWVGAARATDRFVGRDLVPAISGPPAPAFDPALATRYVTNNLSDEQRSIRLLLGPMVSPPKTVSIHSIFRMLLDSVGWILELDYEQDWDEYERRIQAGDWDITLDGLAVGNYDLYTFLYEMYAKENPGGGYGLFAMQDQGFAEYLERARTARSEPASLAAYLESVARIAAQIPCLPLAEVSTFLARSIEVIDFTPGPNPDWTLAQVTKEGWR